MGPGQGPEKPEETGANRQSLISRGVCLLLIVLNFLPMMEYFGNIEPERRSAAQVFLIAMRREPPRFLLLLVFVPALLGLLRLAQVAWKAHIAFAAIGVVFGIVQFLLAALPNGSPDMAHVAVYIGLDGVVKPGQWGPHGAIVAGLCAVWMFDELWARRTFKALDSKN
jgi:hypothetical protein